jgi:predicted N-formylglutamate amidohydrolase
MSPDLPDVAFTPAFDVLRPAAPSRYLLVGDHAGHAIPPGLEGLGVGPADLRRHIACDLGVEGLGGELSGRLDATFIHQRWSRLVIDCNRHPDHPGSIVTESDGTRVPGNANLSAEARALRLSAIFEPYHRAIAAALDAGPATTLVSLHSFTPAMQGQARPWRMGVLHRGDSALSLRVLGRLRAQLGAEAVGDNQPYQMDGTDFTVPHHCDPRGIDYLELEVRQDELADPAGCTAMAALIAEALS